MSHHVRPQTCAQLRCANSLRSLLLPSRSPLRPLEVSFDSGHTYAQDEADDKSKSCDELERQLARTKATTTQILTV
jgi:hypothetical protein